MEQKNRFSNLLERLIATADVKHYVLAQCLQFDVSYISKWVSGRVLPSEKTAVDTLQKLSKCIVENASDSGNAQLLRDYLVPNNNELWQAIYDNLIAEYYYVQELQQNSGNVVAPNVSFYAELSMKKFLSKMHHPVLRRVKSLNIMAAMDLFSMADEYRPKIVSLGGEQNALHNYPDVHFSLLINLDKAEQDIIHNTLFITNILIDLARVDFSLYQGDFSHGKVVFVVKEDFAISGMLIRRDNCACVSVCEGSEYSLPLYNDIQTLCTREALLFRKMEMHEMLNTSMEYMYFLLAPERCWILGHLTEHLLPKEVFDELLESPAIAQKNFSKEALLNLHKLSNAVFAQGETKLLVSNSAFSRLVVSGEVDFFNERLTLNFRQRIKVLEYLCRVWEYANDTNSRMIRDPLVADFHYSTIPSMFLSGTVSYLRLNVANQSNNLLLNINGQAMQNVYKKFFAEVWNNENQVVSDGEQIRSYLEHLLHGLRIMNELEEQKNQVSE